MMILNVFTATVGGKQLTERQGEKNYSPSGKKGSKRKCSKTRPKFRSFEGRDKEYRRVELTLISENSRNMEPF